jgi:hypothetical protein
MCRDSKCGYQKGHCPTSNECLFYGDMSQMCISKGEVCNRPWLEPGFKPEVTESKYEHRQNSV